MKKILHFFIPSRFIKLKDTDRSEPLMGDEEFRLHDQYLGVETENEPYIDYHGTEYINELFDQEIEFRRLGIREEHQANMERWGNGRSAGKQILDRKITEALRHNAAIDISKERKRQTYLGRGFSNVVEFLQNNTVGKLSKRFDVLGTRVQRTYGRNVFSGNERFEERKCNSAENILANYNNHQRMTIQNNLVGMGLAFPLPRDVPAWAPNAQTYHLSLANYRQLRELQAMTPFLPQRRIAPLFPGQSNEPEDTPFDRLLQISKVEGEERMNMVNTTIFDAKRLQGFLDTLENTEPATFDLVQEILVPDALDTLQNHPEAQALVSYMMMRNASTDPNVPSLHASLTQIRENLPDLTTETAALTPEQVAQHEQIDGLMSSLGETFTKLEDSYPDALTLGESINSRRNEIATLDAGIATNEGLRTATPRPNKRVLEGINDTIKQMRNDRSKNVELLNKQQIELRNLQKGINGLENKYIQSVDSLFHELNEIFSPIPAAAIHLLGLNRLLPMRISTTAELFGPPTGVWMAPRFAHPLLKHHISAFTNRHYQDINKEIKEHYFKAQETKKERQIPRQLLFLLKEGDMVRSRNTNPDQRDQSALLQTNLMISKAKRVQFFKSVNNEVAELLGGSTLGSNFLDRVRKMVIANLTSDRIYRAREIVDFVAGFDKEFRLFHGMPVDSTLAEIRDRIILNGGINDEKLIEFDDKLQQIIQSFEILSTEDKVELYDDDIFVLERLSNNFKVLREERRVDALFDEEREEYRENPDRDVPRHVSALRKIRLKEADWQKIDVSSMKRESSPIAKWRGWFARNILKENFGAPLTEARKFINDNRLDKEAAKAHYWEKGLTSVAGALGSAYTLAEVIGTGRAVADKTWQFTKKLFSKKIKK